MRNSTTYFNALTLFDTGANTSFVNREVAKWLELQQHGDTVAGAHHARSSRHNVPTSEVGLAGTQLSSPIYGTVVFELTFFNEATKSDNILKNIEANVIDSCIEVIIGMPDIRSHRLVHRIPLYFDSTDPTYLVPPQGFSQASTPSTIALLVRRDTTATSRALCKGSMPCNNCAFFIERGHDKPYALWLGVPTLRNVGTPFRTVRSQTMNLSRRKTSSIPKRMMMTLIGSTILSR